MTRTEFNANTVSLVSKMLRVPVGPGAFPPDKQLEVITLATSKTSEHDCVASQLSLDDLAAELVKKDLRTSEQRRAFLTDPDYPRPAPPRNAPPNARRSRRHADA